MTPKKKTRVMRSEEKLAARRERYLSASSAIARQLDAKGITEKKIQADFEKYKKRRRGEPEVADDDPPLSAAWRKEISRRIKESDDPTRYVIVSGFSRRMLLYYDASNDRFPGNDVSRATLFKRHSVACAVAEVLGAHHVLMKVRLKKDGSIKQLTSIRSILAETWKQPNRTKEASLVRTPAVPRKKEHPIDPLRPVRWPDESIPLAERHKLFLRRSAAPGRQVQKKGITEQQIERDIEALFRRRR
jgi:hypothetical protein